MTYTLNMRGRLQSLAPQSPIIMGILNLTPDSFYEGSRTKPSELVEKAAAMLAAGADWLDVGGVSTRPNASFVSLDEELERVIPAVKALRAALPQAIISLDTFRAEVARQAADFVDIINDVTGGAEPEIWQVAAQKRLPYVLTHFKGEGEFMSQTPHYEDVVTEVYDFFVNKIWAMRASGLHDVILDVGFGFGKRLEDNYMLLERLDAFAPLGRAMLVGISRKSMIYKPLGLAPTEVLAATTALHLQALRSGAQILRVHDVAEAAQVRTLHKLLSK